MGLMKWIFGDMGKNEEVITVMDSKIGGCVYCWECKHCVRRKDSFINLIDHPEAFNWKHICHKEGFIEHTQESYFSPTYSITKINYKDCRVENFDNKCPNFEPWGQ